MINKQPVWVILSPGFPANEADSACVTSQQNLIKSVNKIYPAIRIIILSFQYPFVNATYHWHGNTVIAFNGRNKGKLPRLLLWRKVWIQLKKINRENKVAGLFSFWLGECALLGKYFGTRYNIPHYCWILGQDAKANNKYVRYTRLRGDRLVALSDFIMYEFCRNHGIRPKYVIPNGIVPDQFPGPPANRMIDVLGVGSLIPLKQYEIFIELIRQLKYRVPGINAVICGKGPEEKHLQSLVEKFSLQENISLAGELSHPEILQLMQQSKVLLHPSSYEGFSTVCLEALYAGAHVVSFCRPMKTAIDNWHIVNTPGDMLETMAELLKNDKPDHRRVMPFSMEETAKAILNLFDQRLSITD